MSTQGVGYKPTACKALACYRRESLFIRLFTLARHLLAPLDRVALEVPNSGRILDLGCGHGLFTNLLALGSGERQILGVDPSREKLAVARRSSANLSTVRYLEGRIEDVSDKGFDAITILDVLYLLPDQVKLGVLRRCRELIGPHGLVLVKTNDTRPLWQFSIVRIEEELMVRVLSLTMGGELHFRGVDEYCSIIRAAGFEPSVDYLDSRLPIPHRLYICRPA